jgi:hypothetical protein
MQDPLHPPFRVGTGTIAEITAMCWEPMRKVTAHVLAFRALALHP